MAFLGLVSWSLFVDVSRLVSVLAFLFCTLSFSWYSFASLIAVLVSLYVLDRSQYSRPRPKQDPYSGSNPYRRHKRVKDEDKISQEVWQDYARQVLDLVLYDVENCEALRNFEPVKSNTHCIFSKMAVLWGSRDYDHSISLEHNVTRSLPAFAKFLTVGSTLHLAGFVFELPGEEFYRDVESFGQGVRRTLKCISDADPAGYCCMNKSFLSKVGWTFEFNRVPIFVTTFAACYPDNHSRYTFEVKSSFILMQPMYSFAIHDISPDTPHTNWDCPVTERDKIRVAYRDNNRGYLIRDTIVYPPAHDIVKPMVEGEGRLVEWWRDGGKEEGGDREEGLPAEDKKAR